MTTTDHDVLGNDVKKSSADAPRPHANGCVGCRRAGVCIRCGNPSLLAEGRCISGACQTCCPILHKHVENNPLAVCEAR